MKMKRFHTTQGVTFIEVLLVVAITAIVIAATMPLMSNLLQSSKLQDSSSQLTQILRLAREKSVARINNEAYGVYFTINPTGQDSYTLFVGDTYATRNSTEDRIFAVDTDIAVSTTIPGNEIRFSKGLGIPNVTGTITLQHIFSGLKSITINAQGRVENQ